jgi:putative ABC transport system permease protein
MPEGFDFPMQDNLWMPVVRTPALWQRGLNPAGGFTVVARLRDGRTLEEAQSELDTINRRLAAAYPATNRDLVPTVATYAEMNGGPHAFTIWRTVWGGACFVLLIACANLANLTLVRNIGRSRELSTRLALGAGHAGIVRHILIESVIIVGAAAAVGWWLTTLIVPRWAAATASRYQILDYSMDARAFSYLIAIAAIATGLISLAPIVRILRHAAGGTLVRDTRGATTDLRGRRVAMALVAGQMTLAIVLLAGAGVLIRSFIHIVAAETGVRDPQRILVGLLRLPSDEYPTADTRLGYFERVEAQLGTVPGVAYASVTSTAPVRFARLRRLEIDGRPAEAEGDPFVSVMTIGSGYFRVVGLSAVAGRSFDARDHAAALPVAIVNESFVAKYWPGEQALGRRLRSGTGDWRIVVGVVPNILQADPTRQTLKPLVYLPFQQDAPALAAYFLARTSVAPDRVAQALRSAVQEVDADVSLEQFSTLQASFAFDRDAMDAEHSELGKYAAMAPVFAVTAVVVAATGLIAVTAHSVSQRTKEIGVRMAIGAAAADISRMILREGMAPAAAGVIAGLAGSFAVNRVLQSQLVGVSPYDPITMAAAPLFLLVVALAACQIPARRAMHVDPVVALRHE